MSPEARLEGLNPATRYSIEVMAVNRVGERRGYRCRYSCYSRGTSRGVPDKCQGD